LLRSRLLLRTEANTYHGIKGERTTGLYASKLSNLLWIDLRSCRGYGKQTEFEMATDRRINRRSFTVYAPRKGLEAMPCTSRVWTGPASLVMLN
jgi:hypothetical protein